MGCGNCFFGKLQKEGSNHIGVNELNSCSKLATTDWLSEYENNEGKIPALLEIRFKNTRKDFYLNPGNILLYVGDVVVVEASKGYDIGIVSLKGILAEKQLRRKASATGKRLLLNVIRKASAWDIEKWKKSRQREYPTMIKARQIASLLNLEMKIGDVEYQGDNTKAIFYYLAEDRIDFRELIKVYAGEFKVKIEMKQIGARQEAAKIGGIGSCGRELCCSTWRTDFTSISANYAKIQELPINAQKLAGQCGKLKCCLTYELENYLEAREDFPTQLIELETSRGILKPVKIDVLKKIIWYAHSGASAEGALAVSVESVKKIINLNKRGIKVEDINHYNVYNVAPNNDFKLNAPSPKGFYKK